MFKVQRKMCSSCIYRKSSPLDIKKLEADVADPRMDGHFKGFRECHHAKRRSGVCCAGFWRRHKDHFDAGQLAQRLGVVQYVSIDVLTK
jgi:hypothetical protein